ncbi:MAG TPA: zf-HC2 domain-containing protein [Gemmatimonadaceae bacterium]|jgi:anti-sigma factor RsiW
MNVEVRDALPDLLNGRLSALDTATMKAHVESCADCRAELALLREARSNSAIAPSIDVARIAAALPAYGGAEVTIPAVRERTAISRMWKFAAAIVLVATGGWLALERRGTATSEAPQVATAPQAAPESSPVREPSPSVVATPSPETTPSRSAADPNREVQVASLSLVGSTADISDADLEHLVAQLDAIDSMPAHEPSPVTITVEDIDGESDQ